MESRKTILIALYDATSDLSLYGDADLARDARTLGTTLGNARFGVVGRVGSPTIATVLSSVFGAGNPAIGLSPASSEIEHEKAFRLPKSSVPTIYTGRGALGADVTALASSHAALIVGSEEESLLGILGCIGESYVFPVGILTTEAEQAVRERILARYPQLAPHVFISNNPETLVGTLSSELRKRHLNKSFE